MRNRSVVLLSIMLLTIAFASVATNLIINVTTSIGVNYNDFDVYFSASYENGTKNNRLIRDDRHIVFSHSMSLVGEKYTLSYDVTNGSREYDANVSINCTNGNEHLKIVNDFDEKTTLLATKTRTGVLTIELVTGYIEDTEFNITCEITGTATKRDSVSDDIPNDKVKQPVNLYNLVSSKNKDDASILNYNLPADESDTGVYKTMGEGNKDVYFYRGNVIDNNVIFAGFCWKIVRTTETGGTKLIYNGVVNDGMCDNTEEASQIGYSSWNELSDDNAYVGYMYGTPGSNNYNDTHANINDSAIKVFIDAWYEANLKDTSYETYLEDTVWCNDRSMVTGTNNNTLGPYGTLGYAQEQTAYGVVARSAHQTKKVNPSLVCPNNNDKFTISSEFGNGALSYPIGLMTLDEAALAGLTSGKNADGSDKVNKLISNEHYLFTNVWFWSLSAHAFNKYGSYTGHISDVLSNEIVNIKAGVRPCISLTSSTEVTLGDGTKEDPFVVE